MKSVIRLPKILGIYFKMDYKHYLSYTEYRFILQLALLYQKTEILEFNVERMHCKMFLMNRKMTSWHYIHITFLHKGIPNKTRLSFDCMQLKTASPSMFLSYTFVYTLFRSSHFLCLFC